MPITACSKASSPISRSGSTPQDLTDRALELGRDVNEHRLYAALRLLSARHVLQQEALRRRPASPSRRRRSTNSCAAAEKVSKLPGKYGYCLRGGPGGLNGWMMFGATMAGANTFFNEDGTSTLNSEGWVKGIDWWSTSTRRASAEGQRQLGLQRDRRRLLFRHLRHARPGSGRADRHRRAHEAGGFRRHADAEGPGRQGLPDHRLCRLVDVLRPARTRTWPGS